MRPPRAESGIRGIDLMLTTMAVVLALICIPMVFDMSGGANKRLLLLGTLLLPPILGLLYVHRRDGAPRSSPAPVEPRFRV